MRVGTLLHIQERVKNDGEYRTRLKLRRDRYYKKNKEKIIKKQRHWVIKLNNFKNKRCKKCNKLVDYRTKGEYCRKHRWLGEKEK